MPDGKKFKDHGLCHCRKCGHIHEPNEIQKARREAWKKRRECVKCGEHVKYTYMLKADVWAKVGLAKGQLHLECAEALLGRTIELNDLNDAPCNEIIHWAWTNREGR